MRINNFLKSNISTLNKYFALIVLFAVIICAVFAVSGVKVNGAASSMFVTGDVNGDGYINVSDCVKVSLYINNSVTLSNSEISRADVNCDGKVDNKDLTEIAKYCSHIISSFSTDLETPIIKF